MLRRHLADIREGRQRATVALLRSDGNLLRRLTSDESRALARELLAAADESDRAEAAAVVPSAEVG